MSETIGKLAAALAKAQADIKGAKKDVENTFFKSKYADLAAVWEACRDALSKNELAVAQPTEIHDGQLVVKTILMHSSGETITGIMPVVVGDKATAQQVGSAITYSRRYALAAMVGVAPEDDDGNEASKTQANTSYKKELPTLAARATAFSDRLEKMASSASLTTLVATNNPLLAELREKLPQDYEKISVKITQMQDKFHIADAAE